jgi:tetratricopeptide (TPR) repeat protein
MVGVGGFGTPGGAAAAPPSVPPAPTPAAPPVDEGIALPAVKPAAPKPGRPAPKPIANAAPAAPPPAALPGLDDLDLPALAGDVGLPAPANRPAAKPAPAPAGGGFNFEMDLPAVRPSQGGGGFGDVDLPMAKSGDGGFGEVGLPSPKAQPAAFGSIDLPSPRGFGDAGGITDLPLVAGNLPAVSHGHANLPSPANPAHHLPAPKRGGVGFGELDLPSLQNDLPNPANPQAHMPMPVSDDRLLPNRGAPAPAGGPPAMAFGELDLPLVGGGGAAPEGAPAPPKDVVSFGELDLPNDPSLSAPAPVVPSQPPMSGGAHGAPGGMGFGEVDLGGGGGGSVPPMGPPPATSAGTFAFQEASLEGAQPPPAMRPRPMPAQERRSSKAPKILAALAILVVGGGAGLELTPVGAFGRNFISDRLNRGSYARTAQTLADVARKKMDTDTYAAVAQAADDLAEARRKSPRSRPLSGYAAFAEFYAQARFGGNAQRLARAKTFLADIPPAVDEPYLTSARAAQEAAAGDYAKARPLVDAAMAKDPKDGIQQDLAMLKGEILLGMKDAASAEKTFLDLLRAGPSARGQFGLARAYYAQKKLESAKKAVDETLKLSPNHAGAHTLGALLAWELKRDDGEALKELAKVLDANARQNEGPSEVSMALAAKGTIMLARDRAGEARQAFDEAVKIDPRNVAALTGQGEVLYADGRYTEALTRFEEAVQKDGASIPAILGAAKTKIALERFADAKTQLIAARRTSPKDMGLALWLAKTEEMLANRAEADKLYQQAIDLADPQNPEAIQAYAQYAGFLAAQGKTSDAQAKLDQARSKLPDSAALQRAFGEVAAAQGHYDEAVGHFESALQKNPGDLGTRFRLGVTYRRMRKLDLAAQELDKVAAVDKEYPGIALERGLLFEESGDIQKALEQFNQAYQKAPKDIDLKLRVGAAYVAVGKIEEALPLLNEVKNQRPNSAEANHFIGRAYLKQGGLEAAAAMRYLQRAVELDPNRAEYHLYVAWAANDATPVQLGLARTHVDKALALDKLLADGYWQRGVVERREGAVNDAIKDLKRALELKPSRYEAHATLAECYEDKNDVATAMKEWALAIAADDKQPMWRFKYGKHLLEKGNAAEAAKHLTFAVNTGKGLQQRPGWLAPAAFEAGEALRKTNQKAQALEMYQLFLELAGANHPDSRDAKKWVRELGGENR